jgi:hypothetical protein
MRKSSFFKILGIFALLVGASIPSVRSSLAAAPEDWQDMPPLVLNNCIDIDKVLAPNPLSAKVNEFWMVLKYEEKDGESGKTKGMDADHSLNMYLVTGLALIAKEGAGSEEGIGLPYYQFLIVTLTNKGGSSSSSKIVLQWLLSDSNNDGKLDHAKFERIITDYRGEKINSEKMDIPIDQVQKLQDFYEKATRELNSKAEEETSSQCLVS